MNILVAMGSFKDVFSPVEMTAMVADALTNHNIIQMPMCDGGEYTYDVIKYHKKCKEIFVKDVINPYGKRVDSRYLAIEDTAYVISSEIIRLYPEEDKYMNPMLLTDYGLGQLCKDAINKGYTKIHLCLGGTSTVGFGMGFAQAMGAIFKDHDGKIIHELITPNVLKKVSKIDVVKRNDVQFLIINDGVTTAHDLSVVNPQKIGVYFSDIKQSILDDLDNALSIVCSLTGMNLDISYGGNAGGVCFGIETITNGHYVKGTEFFMNLFGVEKFIQQAEMVITGEGRLDNMYTEKLPVFISMVTKKLGKVCEYICGQKGEDITANKLLEYGISEVICCCDHYFEIAGNYTDCVETYRKLTPIIIKKELSMKHG